jgi:hypothetical protein
MPYFSRFFRAKNDRDIITYDDIAVTDGRPHLNGIALAEVCACRSRGERGMLRLRRFRAQRICATGTLALACFFTILAAQTEVAQAQGDTAKPQAPKKKEPRLSITISPTWIFSTSSDAYAPPPAGFTTSLGYPNYNNAVVDTMRVDWAVDYLFAPKWHVFANETYYAYQLSRITNLAPKTSFLSGSLLDYWQNFGVSTSPFTGLSVHLNYFNHQRSDVTGLCLNQMDCPVNGAQQVNPLSINSHGYELGLGYDFGPKFATGQLFNVTGAADYYNRPSTGPAGFATGGLCASPPPASCWVGSTVEFPYSITARLPLVNDSSVTPSITYLVLPVLYEDSAVPEDYRGIVWGVSKTFSPNVSLGYTNFNLMSCKCIARVPPPQVLQLTWGQLQLSLHGSF